ncbi:MAG: cytochrome P450 [Myxococcota bacterium]
MSESASRLAAAYDLLSPAFHADPHPVYDAMRREAPIYEMPFGGAMAVFFTRFEDVDALISDERLQMSMTSWEGFVAASPDDPRAKLMTISQDAMPAKDGAEHTRLRRLVNQGFTPRAMRAFDANLVALVDAWIGRVAERERFDLHGDLAQRVPIIAISRLLGVPEADEARFVAWADALVQAADPFASDATAQAGSDAIHELEAYVAALVAERRGAPADDLLSSLVAAEDGSERLTLPEIQALCMALLVAGSETTSNLIDLGVKALIEFPDVRRQVEAAPERIADVVEEALRFDHPGKFLTRVAKEDFTLPGGFVLPKGALAMCGIGAAHRDPARFPDPARFDLDRDHRDTIVFGKGRHSCLGSRLARREGSLVLGKLLPWIAELRYDADAIEWRQSLIVRGMDRFPVERTA